MKSSIAAVTLIMGVGSGLSSAMKVACHGSGLTVVPHRRSSTDLLIRRSGHFVQDRPLQSLRWADIPQLSTWVRCRPAAWLQSEPRSLLIRRYLCVTPWSPSPSPGLSPATWPRPVLSQPLPRTRLLPNLVTDGFCQGHLRVHMDQAVLPKAVVLRSQRALTGSRSHRPSYGGFGGGHRTSTSLFGTLPLGRGWDADQGH